MAERCSWCIGVGGRLYVVSFYAVALVILVLRLGPRLYFQDDASSYASDGDYYDDMSTDDDESFAGSDEMSITLSGTEAWDRQQHGLVYDNEDDAKRIAGTMHDQHPIQRSRSCPNLSGEKFLKNDEQQRQEKQQQRRERSQLRCHQALLSFGSSRS